MNIQISAVAFPEGDLWIVQGIEYDIVARAQSPSEIPAAFMKAIAENVCITNCLGREPLDGIRPAPAHYRDAFEAAQAEPGQVWRPDGPPGIADVDIRLVASAA